MRLHETPAAPAPAAAGDLDGIARPVVLLVEDDAEIGSLMAEMLEGLDCALLAATSGEAALALLERHSVLLAIVDQTLPGMPGPAFVARARASRPALRAIHISGAPIEDAAPSDTVLRKPFRAAQLRAAVRAALECQAVDQRPGSLPRAKLPGSSPGMTKT